MSVYLPRYGNLIFRFAKTYRFFYLPQKFRDVMTHPYIKLYSYNT